MSAHALLSASGSSRWMNCPGSVRLTRDMPEETSPFAQEGTVAHDIAEKILRGEAELDDYPDHQQLSRYIDFIAEQYDTSMDSILFIEERLSYTDWVPDGFGTSDATIINPADKSIHIVDLKWGKGVQVFADNNSQMRLYALGALQRFMFEYELETVHMTIVQPRLDHIDTDTISVNALLKFGEEVKLAARMALMDDAPTIPSPKACQWCKAKTRCRARALDMLSNGTSDNPLLSNEELSDLLPLAKDLEKWAKDLQAYMLEMAMEGETIRGHKLVEGRSVRRWTDNAAEVLAEAVEDSEKLYEKKLLGIGAIEKLVGKKLVNEVTTKPAGKPALVPSTDKRPEIVAPNVDFPTGE